MLPFAVMTDIAHKGGVAMLAIAVIHRCRPACMLLLPLGTEGVTVLVLDILTTENTGE